MKVKALSFPYTKINSFFYHIKIQLLFVKDLNVILKLYHSCIDNIKTKYYRVYNKTLNRLILIYELSFEQKHRKNCVCREMSYSFPQNFKKNMTNFKASKDVKSLFFPFQALKSAWEKAPLCHSVVHIHEMGEATRKGIKSDLRKILSGSL